jgi:hypothetical protein
VQESSLSGIVKAEEQQLCVLVGEAKRGQEIEDWRTYQRRVSTMQCGCRAHGMGYVELRFTYTCRRLARTPLTVQWYLIGLPVDNPHVAIFLRGAVFKGVCTAAIVNVNLSGFQHQSPGPITNTL